MKSRLAAICICFMLILRVFTVCATANGADLCFYLECEKISENMLRVDICVSDNSGFCGALFALEYNRQIVSYSHATRGENLGDMNFTPTTEDSGRINMLFDSTENLCFDGRLASVYFLILTEDINISFKLFGGGDVSVAKIDNGSVLGVKYTAIGYTAKGADADGVRILGFQKRGGDIRIVGLTQNGFDNIGIYITRVDIDKGKVTSGKIYLDAYLGLNGTDMTPTEFGYDCFFAHKENIENSIVCFYVTPFCAYEGGEIIGKEKIILFYKGEYI